MSHHRITITPYQLESALKRTVRLVCNDLRYPERANGNPDEILTAAQAGRALHVRRELVTNAIKSGELPASRKGVKHAIKWSDLTAWAKRVGKLA